METDPHTKQNFNAHGKLLISGEYFVLRGAKALTVPLKYGQSLHITATVGEPLLLWKAHYPGKEWFEAKYDTIRFDILETDNPGLAQRLQNIFREVRKINPEFLKGTFTTVATSSLDFPPQWGIGSSSSLLANIGRWARVNPYELNRQIFGGSGYDIAAALSDKPVIYQLQNGIPAYETVDFAPSFKEKLFLVYQNQKQNSQKAVQNFAKIRVVQTVIDIISNITLKMASTGSFEEFMTLMDNHEHILAEVLQQVPIQLQRFPDFEGSIKSMGAWGGDFLLAASEKSREYVMEYFKIKGFETVLGWDEMVLP
jgi:mevalonate kinase